MKPRDFLNFFKTRTGKLVVFGTLFGGGLIIFSTIRQHHTAIDIITAPLMTNSVTAQPEVIQTVVRPMQVFHPPPPKAQPISPSQQPGVPYPTIPKVSSNVPPRPLPVVPQRQAPWGQATSASSAPCRE